MNDPGQLVADEAAESPSAPLRNRLVDYFFGYDFFVSYRWADGRQYAVKLRDTLARRGLVVFLDSSDFERGESWKKQAQRALRRSSRLLVVGSPQVHESNAVLKELEIFSKLGRRIMPIDIAGSLAPGREGQLMHYLPPELLRFEEKSIACLVDGPSIESIEDIIGSFDLIRQHTRRLRWLVSTLFLLLGLVIATSALGMYAQVKRQEADAEAEAARVARDHSENRRLQAEAAQANAVLENPQQWAAGLALVTAAAASDVKKEPETIEALRFVLLRAVWLATPYRVVASHASRIANAAFLPASACVSTVGNDDKVRIFDSATSSVSLISLSQRAGKLRRISFAADEARIATVDDHGRVDVWRTNGEWVRTIVTGGQGVVAAFLTADGQRVITAGSDGAIRSWALDSGTDEQIWNGNQQILDAAITTDGARLAIVDDAPSGHIIDLTHPERQVSLHTDHQTGRLVTIAFSADGDRVITWSQAELIEVWDAKTGRREQALAGYIGEVSATAFSPDGTRAVSGGLDGTVRVWELASGQHRTFFGHLGPVVSVAFSKDGEHILSSSEDGTVRLWDAHPERAFVVINGRMAAQCEQSVTRDGGRMVTLDHEGVVRVSETLMGQRVAELPTKAKGFHTVAVSPDGKRVATEGANAPPTIWDVATGRSERQLPELKDSKTLAWSNDAAQLAIVTKSGTSLWELTRGRLRDVESHEKVYAAVFSPDAAQIATLGSSGAVSICGAKPGGECSRLDAHSVYGSVACFSHDGGRLVSGGGDRIAHLWQLRTGENITLSGHGESVDGAVFAPGDERVYTTSAQEQAVRAWDAATGELLGRVDLPFPSDAALELPGNRLAVTTGGQTWIGSMELNDLLARACAVLRPLESVAGIKHDKLKQLQRDCARLGH